mmetsp:Transcript_25082/g.49103  ORF Transcript_25082/g.49103 Transcript_25082/m.49103 type:complete len:236 (+) Transcript_25082:65-772(+)
MAMAATPKRTRAAQFDPPSGTPVRQRRPRVPAADELCGGGKPVGGENPADSNFSSLAAAVSIKRSDGATDGVVETIRRSDNSQTQEANEVGNRAAEFVPLAVTCAEQGTLEFEFEGEIYRVVDPAAFATLVASAPKAPQRSLQALRRAQLARRNGSSHPPEGQQGVQETTMTAPKRGAQAHNADTSGEPSASSRAWAAAHQSGPPRAANSMPDGVPHAADWGCPSLAEELNSVGQ